LDLVIPYILGQFSVRMTHYIKNSKSKNFFIHIFYNVQIESDS